MNDIAKHCNVTKMTVSRVLHNDRDHVSLETISRVTKAINELGYDPARQQAARRLALQKVGRRLHNQVVAFYYPQDFYFSVYFSRILGGITGAIMQEKYALLSVATDIYEKTTLHPAFGRGDVDGIISIAPPKHSKELLSALRAEMHFDDRPAVSIIYPVEGCSLVLTDDRTGGLESARHLLDLGHRHILHFSKPDKVPGRGDHPTDERFKGYQQAYRERELDPDVYLHGETWPELGPGEDKLLTVVPLLQETLRTHPYITAILARNDWIAARVQHALACMGLSVPDDISIVGFDDTDPIYDERGNNTLTTVQLPLYDVGKTAVEIIVDAARAESTEKKLIVLPTKLIVRNSTAPVQQKVSQKTS